MRYTLKQLQYFVAVAQAGSIKLASEQINISQPSISTAITHLERELSVQLFVRHHAQGLSLTTSGQRVLRDAKLLLRQSQNLYTLAHGLTHDVAGPLTVGCLVTLAPLVLPQLAQQFATKHPQVSLHLKEANPKELVDQLRRVDIDVAISYDLQLPEQVCFEPLASLPAYVLVATDHRLAARQTVHLKELQSEPMILLDLPFSRQYFFDLFGRQKMSPTIHTRSQNPEVVRALVANGFGYTIANVRPKNTQTLDGREVVVVELEGNHKPMTLGIATLGQELKPKVVQSFEEHCRSMISDGHVPGMDLSDARISP